MSILQKFNNSHISNNLKLLPYFCSHIMIILMFCLQFSFKFIHLSQCKFTFIYFINTFKNI